MRWLNWGFAAACASSLRWSACFRGNSIICWSVNTHTSIHITGISLCCFFEFSSQKAIPTGQQLHTPSSTSYPTFWPNPRISVVHLTPTSNHSSSQNCILVALNHLCPCVHINAVNFCIYWELPSILDRQAGALENLFLQGKKNSLDVNGSWATGNGSWWPRYSRSVAGVNWCDIPARRSKGSMVGVNKLTAAAALWVGQRPYDNPPFFKSSLHPHNRAYFNESRVCLQNQDIHCTTCLTYLILFIQHFQLLLTWIAEFTLISSDPFSFQRKASSLAGWLALMYQHCFHSLLLPSQLLQTHLKGFYVGFVPSGHTCCWASHLLVHLEATCFATSTTTPGLVQCIIRSTDCQSQLEEEHPEPATPTTPVSTATDHQHQHLQQEELRDVLSIMSSANAGQKVALFR